MVPILMMSAKVATLDLLKIKVFSNKIYDFSISNMTSVKKFYNLTYITLYMWSCDQTLINLEFL